MGCWQETCGLTNTPIYQDERCVMVVIDVEWRQHEWEIRAKYGEDGTFLGQRATASQWKIVHSIHRGTYNDYGWLNEVDEVTTDEIGHIAPALFFHEAVWDWAQTQDQKVWMLAFESAESYDVKVTPELLEFAKLCSVAFSLRRDPFSGLKFQGHQEWVEDARKDDFLDLHRQILDRHKKMFEDADD
jgi:hypothetical protein